MNYHSLISICHSRIILFLYFSHIHSITTSKPHQTRPTNSIFTTISQQAFISSQLRFMTLIQHKWSLQTQHPSPILSSPPPPFPFHSIPPHDHSPPLSPSTFLSNSSPAPQRIQQKSLPPFFSIPTPTPKRWKRLWTITNDKTHKKVIFVLLLFFHNYNSDFLRIPPLFHKNRVSLGKTQQKYRMCPAIFPHMVPNSGRKSGSSGTPLNVNKRSLNRENRINTNHYSYIFTSISHRRRQDVQRCQGYGRRFQRSPHQRFYFRLWSVFHWDWLSPPSSPYPPLPIVLSYTSSPPSSSSLRTFSPSATKWIGRLFTYVVPPRFDPVHRSTSPSPSSPSSRASTLTPSPISSLESLVCVFCPSWSSRYHLLPHDHPRRQRMLQAFLSIP